MNLLPNNLRDSCCPAQQPPRLITNHGRGLWPIAVLFVALIAMPAAGQEKKAEPKAGEKGCSKNAKAPETWKPDAPKESGEKKPLGPKWFLESTEVVLEPVWRGEQIACSFDIKNRGDANLKIQAKGG